MMRYLSMFSGIEAASVAWKPLGWQAAAFCEFDKFPSAVLAHHYPHVPNLGDVTKADFDAIGPIDLAVFGSPCQSFSVAGKRLGLDDPRGNLALLAAGVVYRKRPRWFLFENVPGLLSSDEGQDFGTLLAAFAGYPSGSVFQPPSDGWGAAGVVEPASADSYGLAWRVLDAQYFGVAQRRRRVFVVGYLGDWRPPAAVLFERESLSGHPAPRREAGKGSAAGATGGAEGGDLARSLRARSNASHREDSDTYVPLISPALKARDHKGPSSDGDGDGDGATLVATAFKSSHFTRGKDGAPSEIAPPLSADADKGDQDTLICFFSKDHGADAELDLSPTLRAGGHHGSHSNAGVPPAIAFALRGREGGAVPEVEGDGDQAGALRAADGGSSRDYVAFAHQGGDYIVQPAIPLQEVGKRTGVSTTDVRAGLGVGEAADPMFTLQSGAQHGVGHGPSVRRLTPRECERLQGFPDDYTLIPLPLKGRQSRQRWAADGPRYKALGNSFAVPVVRWIGRRIEAVETILTARTAA